MEIKDFFTLRSKLVLSTFKAYPTGLKEFYPIDPDRRYLFDQHKLILSDYDDISFPVIFKHDDGSKLRDVLDTGWAGLYLISEKMKTVLEENGLMGWKTYEVKVLDKKNNEIPGYHGLSITGRCGPIDYSKSEIIEKRLVPHGPLGKYYRGLYVGLDQWDGSDFFLPESNLGTIVTRRAAEILKKNKLTNVVLNNLAEIETPDFGIPRKDRPNGA